MKNSRLLALFYTLSKKEIRSFKKFVRSPYFNQRRDVVALFDLLCTWDYVKKGAPEKAAVFQLIYKKETFDDHQLRMCMSFLFKGIEEFLVMEAYRQKDLKRKTALTSIYRQRGLTKHFEWAIGEGEAKLEKQRLRNGDYYVNSYNLQLERYQFSHTKKPLSELRLQELTDHFDLSFIIQKLWQACFLLSHQTVYKKEYEIGLLPAVLNYIESKDLLENPAIAVYYYCYQALSKPYEPSFFEKFKKRLFANTDLFEHEEIRDLFLLANNFCVRQYNQGSRHFLKDQLELYQEGFAKNFYLVNGVLSQYTYQNAVTFGLVRKEFKWVEELIYQYKELLPESAREPTFSFNLARLKYEQKDYNSALILLQKADYQDLFLNLAAKTLQIKIFYELEEFDLLDAHLNAMKRFLKRKKKLGYHQEIYENTIRFARKLIEINPFDKKLKAVLSKAIEETKLVAEKNWLLEKLD